MLVEVLKSKVENVNCLRVYDKHGGVTLSPELMDEINIIEGEKVIVIDSENGNQIECYVNCGKVLGGITLNGNFSGFNCKVTLMSFAYMDVEKAKTFKPCIKK